MKNQRDDQLGQKQQETTKHERLNRWLDRLACMATYRDLQQIANAPAFNG